MSSDGSTCRSSEHLACNAKDGKDTMKEGKDTMKEGKWGHRGSQQHCRVFIQRKSSNVSCIMYTACSFALVSHASPYSS